MQQAIPYSSGRRAWLTAGRRGPAFLDRSSLETPPLSESSATTTATTTTTSSSSSSSSSSSGAGSFTSGGSGSGCAAAAASLGCRIQSLVSENPVLVLSRRGCCMCHVVRRLLLGLGVNPTVCEVDEDPEETTAVIIKELTGAVLPGATDDVVARPAADQFPAVFIGGKYVGGLDRLMAAHISGELVPILKEAGALWL